MTLRKMKHKVLRWLLTAVLVFAAANLTKAVEVRAESGAIYSCTINRSYSNPVTGVVEDSGGEASYATGQGMVEGCVYASGMMEVTASGNYYLTVRMSLMDYTSNHSFVVQNVGDSGWMNTGIAVTANGSDSNGTTADICIQVPSENCIVRGSMYVSPMGRDVIFYFYPSNYTEGNSVGMTPAFVTTSGAGTDSTGSTASTSQAANETLETSGAQAAAEGESTGKTLLQGDGLQPSDAVAVGSTASASEDGTQAGDGTDAQLNAAQGLSLSTAEAQDTSDGEFTLSQTAYSVLVIAGSIVIAGLILIFTAALVVWYFRKNWRRWGGEDDYDDDDED